jgi:hypothetical protein
MSNRFRQSKKKCDWFAPALTPDIFKIFYYNRKQRQKKAVVTGLGILTRCKRFGRRDSAGLCRIYGII